jgi:hypothetical protein
MNSALLKTIKSADVFSQLAYVDEILQAIPDLEITARFKAELLNRVVRYDADPASGRSWKSVKRGPRT